LNSPIFAARPTSTCANSVDDVPAIHRGAAEKAWPENSATYFEREQLRGGPAMLSLRGVTRAAWRPSTTTSSRRATTVVTCRPINARQSSPRRAPATRTTRPASVEQSSISTPGGVLPGGYDPPRAGGCVRVREAAAATTIARIVGTSRRSQDGVSDARRRSMG
jgi:hypothetical protein